MNCFFSLGLVLVGILIVLIFIIGMLLGYCVLYVSEFVNLLWWMG